MKRLTLSAATLALTLFGFGLNADAGHNSHGSYGSAGSTGSSGGSYASSGGSYGSAGGSSGGITRREARLIERAERRSASHGSSGSLGSTDSSGGSYGSHGSSGGSSGSYGSTGHHHRGLLHGLFHGSSGSYGGASSGGASSGGASSGGASSGSYRSASSGGYLSSGYTAPAAHHHAARISPGYAARPNAVPADEFAYIVVQLPEDATLILGGNRTAVAGNVRKFKIPLSDTQRSYPYTVRAEMTRNGQLFVAQSTETLVAGQTVNVKVNDVTAQPEVDVATR
ncbi:MAG: hypothetical protein GY758_10575 [Fuerstiella sp.]|nr:hypothetical protein [Fuerstiella sp.]MCP4508066.1 hypothetical protein [Fuerstiella sp.]